MYMYMCTIVSQASAHSWVSAHILHFNVAASMQTYAIYIAKIVSYMYMYV